MRQFFILAALGVAGYLAWRKFEAPAIGETVRIKDGVNTEGLAAPVAWAVGMAERIFAQFGAPVTVTSARDGVHSERSLHYSGNAVDLRTRDLKPGVAEQITALLKKALGALGFDVVNEGDHIHLEYDPKPGENWLRTVR